MGTWDRPVIMPRQPSFLEQLAPQLVSILGQVGLQKLGQSWKTEEAAKTAATEQKATAASRRFEALLKGADYDPQKGTLTFKPIELTEEQKKFMTVIKTPTGPQLETKPEPGKPTTIAGPKFHWKWDSKAGKFVKTQVPAAPEKWEPTTEAEAIKLKKAGIQPKAFTVNDVNKRLVDLEKAKLKVQTTKGLDPLTMFLIKDNPDAQTMYQSGDIGPAMAEIEGQVRYYQDLRNDMGITGIALPKGLTEKDIEFNMKKYGKTRKETIDAYKTKLKEK